MIINEQKIEINERMKFEAPKDEDIGRTVPWICKGCGEQIVPGPQRCESCEWEAQKLSFHQASRRAEFGFAIVLIVVAILLFALVNKSKGGVVTEELLNDIRRIESANNSRAVGSRGERGAYQLKAIAVRDVNARFGWAFTPADMHRDPVARAYCRAYLLILERRMLAAGFTPTHSTIYGAYRYGFRGWTRATQGHGGSANLGALAERSKASTLGGSGGSPDSPSGPSVRIGYAPSFHASKPTTSPTPPRAALSSYSSSSVGTGIPADSRGGALKVSDIVVNVNAGWPGEYRKVYIGSDHPQRDDFRSKADRKP